MTEHENIQTGQPSFGWPVIENILGGLSILLLIGLTVLTSVDVVARWFGAPISGAFELTQIMLAALIYSALPLTTKAKEHVEVELFSMIFGKGMDMIFHIVAHVASVLVLFVLGWRLWEHGARLAADGAVTDSLGLPFAPIAYFASVSCILSGFIVLVALFKARPKN